MGDKQAQGQPAGIREHISTITLTPEPDTTAMLDGTEPQNGDVIMVDEAGRALSPYNQVIAATVHDLSQEIGRFCQSHLALYTQYQPIFDALSQGIQRAIAESGGSSPYEMPLATVMQFLPTYQHLEFLFFQCHFEAQYTSWITAKDVWNWDSHHTVTTLDQLMVMFYRTSNPRDWVDASIRSSGESPVTDPAPILR